MIDELVVRNLGVIRDARLDFGPGLTVVTGETGAGKTLLLGALRMLLGAEARADLVGPFGDEATVEGRFVAAGAEVGVGRRLKREGRSRAYLNGSIASAEALDAATGDAVEIIGQHDQLTITRPAEIRRLLDRNLDSEGLGARDAYRIAWEERTRLESDRRAVGGDRPALERERVTASHDAELIRAAGLTSDEDDRLAELLGRLRNAEQIRALASDGSDVIGRARDDVGTAVGILRRLAALDPASQHLLAMVDGVESQMGDVAAELITLLEDLDLEPSELEAAEERQSALAGLTRRYGPTLDDVISFGERQAVRAAELETLLARADRIDEEIEAADRRLGTAAAALGDARRRIAAIVASDALDHLRELGFVRPLLEIRVDPADHGPGGGDTATVLFASDDRLEPGSVAKVASGGELSRLVLALRLAGGAGEAESVVFDEIDAGVGGQTAIAVGAKLASLAVGRQVLCVTHLPQVAAHADSHWVVDRDGEEATVREVDGDARVEELTRMLAGMPESARGREAVQELLVRAARVGNTVTS
ncbi:MAG TPA: AAA family ATPase [Acidimicrobiia bacterium]|nr:AAA family ATPase [Acidimicrobiia bacterium]